MAVVTICSDFGAQKYKVWHLFPLFPHLFPMKWWDQMPWSSFSECWALIQLFQSPLSLSSRGFLVPLHFLMFKLVLEKAEEPEIKLPTSAGSSEKQESSRKTFISALLTMPKPLTVWTTVNCGKFWKRWEYQTTWPASWKTYMQVIQSCPALCDPVDSSPPDCSVHYTVLSSQNTGVGCHFLFQGIFQTHPSNSHLLWFLYWQADSFPLSRTGKPKYYLEWWPNSKHKVELNFHFTKSFFSHFSPALY